MVNTVFEKKTKNLSIGQDIQPKGTSTTLSNVPMTSCCNGKELVSVKCSKVSPVINQFPQALDHQTAIRLLELAQIQTGEKQEKKQKLLVWVEKKAASKGDVPAKGMSQLSGPLSFEFGLILSPP